MNLLGSSDGGGRGGEVASEVELALCLFVGIDFRGAIKVDLGLGCRQTKKMRENGGKGNQELV